MKASLGNLAVRDVDQLAAIMKNRLKRIQYRPALIEAFLAQTRLGPRTRTATRPDPDLSTSAVPSAGPAPAVTDTLPARPIASLATCIHSGSPG